ncbi:MAG: Ig-like domain-containing protein, partial [Wujia sp.]
STWISLEFVFTNRPDDWLKDYEFFVGYDGGMGDPNVFCELADDDGKYVSCGLDTNGSFQSDDGDGYKTIKLTLTKPADYYGDGEDKEQDLISIFVNGKDKTSLLDADTLTWTYTPESADGLLICVYWTQEERDYETFAPDPEKEDFIVECWTEGLGQVELQTKPEASVYRKAWNATRASYLVGTKEVTIKIIPDKGEDIDSVLFCGEKIPKEDLIVNEDGTYSYKWDTTGCEADHGYDFGFAFTSSEPNYDYEIVINETPEKFTTIGSEQNFTATVTLNGSGADMGYNWSSSDESIATVDETGKVTAVANGVATITATLWDHKDISASVIVEVSADVDTNVVGSESGYGSDPGTIGAETNIAQDVADSITISDFNTETTKAEMDTQESHLVNNRGEDARLALYVKPLVSAPQVEVEKIESVKAELPVAEDKINEIKTLDISMFKTVAGEAERLTEIAKPITVAITIPDDAILDAAAEGITRHYFLITVHDGVATISDNLDFDKNTKKVTLKMNAFSTRVLGYYDTVDVTSVTITGDTSTLTEVGETTQLSVTVEPEEATIQEVSWTSSNPKVATVDETGKVTAVASGTTTITATSKDRDENVSAEVTIKVSIPVASVEINKTEATLTKAAETLKLTATVLPKEAENKEVTWTSSNPKVATVDATGKVTAIANGTTTITVASKANAELKKECKVTVNIPKAEETPNVTVSYHTHIQTLGDSQGTKTNGQMAGTSGMAKRLENIWVKVEGNKNLGIQYTTHCQTYGWLPWSANGEANGTSGEAKRLEAIKIQLTGADADKYDVYYRVHAQSYGWLAWVKNGEPSGTAGYAKRLEGIQIVVVKKGAQAPGLDYADVKASAGTHNNSGYISKTTGTIVIPGSASTPNVMYKTHVQTFGWQNWKLNGQMSGTSGQAKRLEGINIKLTNSDYAGGIRYSTHVQSYGWQDWKSNGEMSGTSGEAKRLEAIKIELTGEMAKHYDVYYRVHAQSYGWLGWAKNGESAGTEGLAKRLEGIQIVLVPKGAAAPSATYGDIKSVQTSAFIKK